MLLTVPLKKQLFRCSGFPEIIQYLATHGKATPSSAAKATGVSVKTAWSTLKLLKKTGHLDDGEAKWINKDFIIVNLRDVAVDGLFRFSGTRRFLLLKVKSDISLSEAASYLSINYSTIKKLAATLKSAGILTEENKVRNELIMQPENPLSLIPRREHRQAIKFFLDDLRPETPLCMYGDASWGVESLEIDLLALQKAKVNLTLLSEQLINSASATTLRYGFTFNIAVASIAAWFENLRAKSNQTLMDAADGIFIYGSAPKDEDYFACVEGNVDENRINELVTKGYAKRTENGVAYTEKALSSIKEKPITIKETPLKIKDKKVKFISIALAKA
ncbi:MAG: hypothetical protein QW445_07245 [Candidatus Bathyarchaeia archaeon]